MSPYKVVAGYGCMVARCMDKESTGYIECSTIVSYLRTQILNLPSLVRKIEIPPDTTQLTFVIFKLYDNNVKFKTSN